MNVQRSQQTALTCKMLLLCANVSSTCQIPSVFSTAKIYIAPIVPLRHGMEGKLEVLYDGEWGVVCSDDWSEANTQVVCRQLDINAVSQSPLPNDPLVWLSGVRCHGNEIALSQCSHRGWGTVPYNSECHQGTGLVIVNCSSGIKTCCTQVYHTDMNSLYPTVAASSSILLPVGSISPSTSASGNNVTQPHNSILFLTCSYICGCNS